MPVGERPGSGHLLVVSLRTKAILSFCFAFLSVMAFCPHAFMFFTLWWQNGYSRPRQHTCMRGWRRGKGDNDRDMYSFHQEFKSFSRNFSADTDLYRNGQTVYVSAQLQRGWEMCLALSSHRRESKPGGRNQIFETAGNVCHRAIEALLENSGSSRKASYYLLIIWSWMKTSQTQHSWVHDTELKKKVTIFFDQLDLGFF